MAAGQFELAQMGADARYLTDILPGLILTAFGTGTVMLAATIVTMAGVDHDERGVVGGIFQTAQQIGPAVGLAVFATIAAARSSAAGGDLVPGFQLSFFLTGCTGILAIGVVLLMLQAVRLQTLSTDRDRRRRLARRRGLNRRRRLARRRPQWAGGMLGVAVAARSAPDKRRATHLVGTQRHARRCPRRPRSPGHLSGSSSHSCPQDGGRTVGRLQVGRGSTESSRGPTVSGGRGGPWVLRWSVHVSSCLDRESWCPSVLAHLQESGRDEVTTSKCEGSVRPNRGSDLMPPWRGGRCAQGGSLDSGGATARSSLGHGRLAGDSSRRRGGNRGTNEIDSLPEE